MLHFMIGMMSPLTTSGAFSPLRPENPSLSLPPSSLCSFQFVDGPIIAYQGPSHLTIWRQRRRKTLLILMFPLPLMFLPPHVTPPASPVYPPSPGYQFSPFETQMLEGQQQMLASLNQLTLHSTMVDDRLNSLDRRVGQLESDQRAILGPMYAYFNQQGYFRSMSTPPQPPSWYTPSQWGGFGASSWGGGVGAGAGSWGGWSNIGSGSGAAEDTVGGDDDQGPESPGGSWDHHLH